MSIDVWAIHQFKLGGHAAVLTSSLYLAVLKCTSDNDLTEESALHTARNQIRKYATKDTQVAALTKGQCPITKRNGLILFSMADVECILRHMRSSRRAGYTDFVARWMPVLEAWLPPLFPIPPVVPAATAANLPATPVPSSISPSPPPSIASSSAYKPPSVTLLKDCGFSHVTLVIGKEDHFLAESSNLNDFQRSMEELQIYTGSAFAIDGNHSA